MRGIGIEGGRFTSEGGGGDGGHQAKEAEGPKGEQHLTHSTVCGG